MRRSVGFGLGGGRVVLCGCALTLLLAVTVEAQPRWWMPPWWRALISVRERVAELEDRVNALESGGEPVELTVDCTAGGSVATALAQGASTWGPLTITIVGTCPETVAIRRDDTTLRGANPGDGLDGTGFPSDLLTIDADRVFLHQLTLRTNSQALFVANGAQLRAQDLDIDGATFGIWLEGATADFDNVTVRNSVHTQIAARGSYLRLSNCLVEDGGAAGISVGGGTAFIYGCTIQRHTGWGVSMFDNADVTLSSSQVLDNSTGVYMTTGAAVSISSRIADNTYQGVQARDGSVLYLGGATIEDNGGDGVWAIGGSFVLPTNTTIQNNGGSGISLGDTSLAGSWNAAAQPVIVNNVGWGVRCAASPAVAQVQPTGYPVATVTGNGSGASNCPSFGDPTRVP